MAERREKSTEAGKMASFVKHDVLRAFNGDGDLVAWLQKAELVARLTNIKDVASFIPLYLEGGALAVYLEMDSEEQKQFDMIKKRLKEAFTDNEFVAYSKLRESRWTGEPVDVYANELRRLARTCGLEGDGLDQVVRLAFVTGFPESVSVELQQVAGLHKSISVSELVGRARILTANMGGAGMSAPALAMGNGSGARKTSSRGCFACGGPHLLRDCPSESTNRRKSVICFRCGGENHIAAHCQFEQKGKFKGGRGAAGAADDGREPSISAGAAREIMGVPTISVTVGGRVCRALVDTGCSNTMIRVGLVDSWEGEVSTKAFDGRVVKGRGATKVELLVDGKKVKTKSTVVDSLVGDVDIVIGMDVIRQLGGVTVGRSQVKFGEGIACASASVESTLLKDRESDACASTSGESLIVRDRDFNATFDGKMWSVEYFWKDGEAPTLRNRVSLYNPEMDPDKLAKFEHEVETWIQEGILMPWHEEVSEGVIPLMAVEQVNKNKVRPVFDFRELNEAVECHTGAKQERFEEKYAELAKKEGGLVERSGELSRKIDALELQLQDRDRQMEEYKQRVEEKDAQIEKDAGLLKNYQTQVKEREEELERTKAGLDRLLSAKRSGGDREMDGDKERNGDRERDEDTEKDGHGEREDSKQDHDAEFSVATSSDERSGLADASGEASQGDLVPKLRESRRNFEDELSSERSRHRREFERAAQSREEKFQNELRYFIQEKEEKVRQEMERKMEEEVEKMGRNTDGDGEKRKVKGKENNCDEVKKVTEEMERKMKELQEEKDQEYKSLSQKHDREKKELQEEWKTHLDRAKQNLERAKEELGMKEREIEQMKAACDEKEKRLKELASEIEHKKRATEGLKREQGKDNKESPAECRYPSRHRQAPVWHGDYDLY